MIGVLWMTGILGILGIGVPETGNRGPSEDCCGSDCSGMCPAASPVDWLAARLVQWSWCSAMIENSVNLGWTSGH